MKLECMHEHRMDKGSVGLRQTPDISIAKMDEMAIKDDTDMNHTIVKKTMDEERPCTEDVGLRCGTALLTALRTGRAR